VGFVIGGGAKIGLLGIVQCVILAVLEAQHQPYEICKFHHNLWQKIPAVKPGIV